MALMTSGNLLSNGSLDGGMTPTHPTHRAQLSFNTVVLQYRQQGAPWKLGCPSEVAASGIDMAFSRPPGKQRAPFCSVAADKEPVNWYMREARIRRKRFVPCSQMWLI